VRPFAAIGAELNIETIEPVQPGTRRRVTTVAQGIALRETYAIDVLEKPGRESYQLVVRADAVKNLEFQAVDVRPDVRHLVLMVRSLHAEVVPTEKRKFLCGHDERHWFVANLPRTTITNVAEAMESLKPAGLAQMQRRLGVRARDWNRRKNAGFRRQGEWFFVPMPDFEPERGQMVLHNEPIRRGAGKPHTIEFLYRTGGETVWVCPLRPNGLTEEQYRKLIDSKPSAAGWPWRMMKRNPRVYAKGRVRHADHATIVLPFWHLVRMNTEEVGRNVAFLD
jgi:hypothetical protein